MILKQAPTVNVLMVTAAKHHRVVSVQCPFVHRLHANVDYARGKSAMNAGALDAYAVKIVRMRYNATAVINERSRIKYDGRVYQIIPEMFHPNHYDDTLQFHMQLIVNDK